MDTDASTALAEARAIARHAEAVHVALGNEACDDARGSERDRLVAHVLPTFNRLMAEAGREPVIDVPGGHPALRHIALVVAMRRASS